MKTYNKLVRDRIPEILEAEGRKYETEIMSNEEYLQTLREKLVEEAQETARAVESDLIKELADLQEVVDTLTAAYQIDPATVAEVQASRRQQRDGFEKRIKLLWTELIALTFNLFSSAPS